MLSWQNYRLVWWLNLAPRNAHTHAYTHTPTLHPLNASIWTVCTEKRERKKRHEACPKRTVKIVYWQRSDRTRKVLEVVNRKWLSKSRWSMLTAGTKQEIAERLNGCKKKALLLSPWQSQYAHSSCSQSSSTALISPSYKVLQSANTFCLSNALAFNFRTSAGGLEGKAYVLPGRQRRRGDSPTVPGMGQEHLAPARGFGGCNSASGCSPRCPGPKGI